MSTIAFFCTETGVRIVAPGKCKAVDPVNGVDAYNEPTPKAETPRHRPAPALKPETKPAIAPEK